MQNEKCHEPDMQATYLITDNDEVNLSIQKKTPLLIVTGHQNQLLFLTYNDINNGK